MGSYRPPQHGYGPPPGQDAYPPPPSTTYGQQQQPGAPHGYGSPVNTQPQWNQPPPNQQYQYAGAQNPLPPPPSSAPPSNASAYGAPPYQIQTVGGQTIAPVLPPRIPQPYGQPTSPVPNANQQGYQQPAYGGAQQQPPQSHQRIPSVPSAYHQEVAQNTQGWPQHPQYSNKPTTHHYDPPLPPRPGSQGHPGSQQQYDGYGNPLPPQQHGAAGQYGQPPQGGQQPQYQQHPMGQTNQPSPASGSVYSPEDAQKFQHPPSQTPGGYVPPPPPPKPHGYHAADQQPPRPSSVQYGQGQQYHPPPSQSTGPGYPPSQADGQYGQPSSTQQPPPHPTYPGQQPPPATAGYPQPSQPYGAPADQGTPYGQGRQTPAQATSRPGSRPPAQQGYGRPPVGPDDQPVSPLQSRQSISFDRASSTSTPAPQDQSTGKPTPRPGGAFTFSSDWEHFGSGADEIDDTAMYGVKKEEGDKPATTVSVELPIASSPTHARHGSEVSAPESFHPSPAIMPAGGMQHPGARATPPPHPQNQYTPTPPMGHPGQQGAQQYPQAPPPQQQNAAMDEVDYIPPMPDTPPAATRPARTPIVIGGSGLSQAAQPAAYAMQQAMQDGYKAAPPPQHNEAVVAPARTGSAAPGGYVMGDAGGWQQGHVNAAVPPAQQQGSYADAGELRKAHQEVEELRNRLGEHEKELTAARSTAEEKGYLLAERDGAIMQKDALISQKDTMLSQKDALLSQKDTEIAQRTTHLNELQASLTEITETFQAFKASTTGIEEQLKSAQAAQNELKMKLEQAETAKGDLISRLEQSGVALTAASAKHESEKKELDTKLKEAQAGLATAFAETGELKKAVEEAKAKAEAKAAEPVDIAPGLEPWFKGSLERFKDMLYTESKPIPVQEKLQLFMDFVNAEARLRGIDMPFGPKGEVRGFGGAMQTQQPPPSQQAPAQKKAEEQQKPERPRLAPPKESDGFVMVDSDADMQFSPGGRPIFNAPAEEYSPGGRPIMAGKRAPSQPQTGPPRPEKVPGENAPSVPEAAPQVPAYQPFRADGVTDVGSPRGPAQGQPPASQAPPKPAYTPFSWKQGEAGPPAAITPQTPANMAAATPSAQTPAYKSLYKPAPGQAPVPPMKVPEKGANADILIDHVPGMKPGGNRRDTLKGPQDQAMLPSPLKPRTPAPMASNSPSPAAELPAVVPAPRAAPPQEDRPREAKPLMARKNSAIDFLSSLGRADAKRKPSRRIQELASASDAVDTDYEFIKTITKTWEEKAAVTRKQLEKERAKRQAELEARNNELFDSGEIGYGDFETLEEEAKEEEMEAKADEEAEEYESYSKQIFDVVFKRCQDDIAAMVKVQGDAEALMRASAAADNVVSANDKDTSLSDAMQLLLDVHTKLEVIHVEAVKAVQERDRRYKLTQTKPLYAKGDISAMKRVEKAFEEAERKADVKARVERAERCKRVWKIMDAEMERGVAENEDFVADIICAVEDALKATSDDDSGKAELMRFIDSAKEVVGAAYEDTTTLMRLFETVDMQLNEREYEVSVASAKLKNDAKEYFDKLEQEKRREDGKLKADGDKRVKAVGEHRNEAERTLGELKVRAGESRDEREGRMRKERALEEARRRNGAV